MTLVRPGASQGGLVAQYVMKPTRNNRGVVRVGGLSMMRRRHWVRP
jgi:hypothetical protein